MSIDPFAKAIQATTAREEIEAIAAKKKAEMVRQQEEANRSAQSRQQREIAAAKAAEVAEQKRRDEIVHNAKAFILGFLQAVAQYAVEARWSSKEISQAKVYCEKLVCQRDVDLPEVSDKLADIIQTKFKYGLKLAADRGSAIPDAFFVGQRQEWFIAPKGGVSSSANMSRKITITPPSAFDRASRPTVTHTTRSSDLKLGEAITAPGNRKNRRKQRVNS